MGTKVPDVSDNNLDRLARTGSLCFLHKPDVASGSNQH